MTDLFTPELSEVIAEAIDTALGDLHTSQPGTVKSYDSVTQTAEIELGQWRILQTAEGKRTTEKLPILLNVPVMFFRTNTHIVYLPVVAGDTGLVVFAADAIDRWRSEGKSSDPAYSRRHGLSGAVFIPGLVPNGQEISDSGLSSDLITGKIGGIQVRVKGTAVHVTTDGAALADDFVAMAGKVLTQMEAMVDGANAAIAKLNAHTHVTACPAGAGTANAMIPAQQAADLSDPSPVPSSNLKADN